MTAQMAKKLADELRQRFDAIVEPEEVRPGRYRIDMVSSQFSQLTPWKRQELVWEVVDQLFTKEQSDDITIVLPFAPGETEQFLPV